jgi:predicted glycoside hydrolase/deacetylase ChbG (UPF0249 family)
VNTALARSAGSIPLDSTRIRSSSRVRSTIAAASLPPTVVAPRTPRIAMPRRIIPDPPVEGRDAGKWRRMKRLIVNADDFGRSGGVNAGVLEAHAKGIVTSATVMVLEPSAARGIREAAEKAPKLSLGLHFTLTGGGPPAAAARQVPSLAPEASSRGGARRWPRRCRPTRCAASSRRRSAFSRSSRASAPSHLDCHHHVSLHPSVEPVVAQIARKYSLPVRGVTGDSLRRLRAAGVKTPDRFVDRFYGESAGFETLAEILETLPEGTTELMCHPGHADERLKSTSTYAGEREHEIEVLTDPAVRKMLKDAGVKLIPYDAL